MTTSELGLAWCDSFSAVSVTTNGGGGYHEQRRCACCFKPFGDYEPFIEYLYKFYHGECFRCHVCQRNFSSSSTPSSSQSAASTSMSSNEEAMSIVINRYGQLVCLKDYIE